MFAVWLVDGANGLSSDPELTFWLRALQTQSREGRGVDLHTISV